MHVRQLDCIEPPEVPDPRGAHTHLQTLFQAPPHIRKIGGQKGQRDFFSGAEGEQQLLQECTTPHTSCPYLSLILGEAFSYYKNVANCHLQDTNKDQLLLKEAVRAQEFIPQPQRILTIG